MTQDQQTPEPLEQRPEARAFKVEDLLAELRRGRLRIPSFQRGIRWQRENAQMLFDSLYRGFPVGTLLFWETDAEPDEVHFGSVHISAGKRNDALWVVDGQQRLVSLARVLLAPAPDQDGFALYFDLDNRVFVRPPKDLGEDRSRWLPMTEVLSSERLIQWAFAHVPENQARREQAFTLGRRIREYEIPAYLVRTDREDVLREVFARTNSTGVELKQSEVFDALHGGRGQTSPATIGQIVSDLKALDFGRLEERLLYRLLRVLRGADVIERTSDGPLRLSAADAFSTYRETRETAERVIHFLKADVGIARYELLPYKQAFVLLGKFFKQHPDPAPRSRDLLARWVWRGALNGAHRGDTASTRRSIERIVSDNEDMSVQRLLEMVKDHPNTSPDATAPFNFRHATSKLQVLALLDLKPRDLETGALIDLDLLAEPRERDLSMPQVFVSSMEIQATSVTNRLLHPKRPGLRKILLKVSDPAILASHGIPEQGLEALRECDTEGFFAARAELLRDHFARFFARHARWDEPDRPSLAALVIDDEEL